MQNQSTTRPQASNVVPLFGEQRMAERTNTRLLETKLAEFRQAMKPLFPERESAQYATVGAR